MALIYWHHNKEPCKIDKKTSSLSFSADTDLPCPTTSGGAALCKATVGLKKKNKTKNTVGHIVPGDPSAGSTLPST